MTNENTEDITNDVEMSEYTEADYLAAQAKIDQLEKEKQTLLVQKQKYKEKANKQAEVQVKSTGVDDDWKAKIELKVEGYNDEEIKFIQQNGGKAALENPYVKKALELLKEQAAAEKGVASAEDGKSEVEKKHSMDELKNMSVAELEKLLPKA